MCIQLHNLHLLYNSSNIPYHSFDLAYVKKVTAYLLLYWKKKKKKLVCKQQLTDIFFDTTIIKLFVVKKI